MKTDKNKNYANDGENLVSTHCSGDHFTDNVIFGDLSVRQYAELENIARDYPQYNLTVERYAQRGNFKNSSATHIKINEKNFDENVALVGKKMVHVYDNLSATEQIARKIAHRVYRFSGWYFEKI